MSNSWFDKLPRTRSFPYSYALKARNKVFDSHIYDNAPGGHTFLFGDSPEQQDVLHAALPELGK